MMEPPDHMCEPPRTQDVELFTVLTGGVKRTLPFTSISSFEEVMHITTQLYFTKKLDSAKILGQVGSREGAGRYPGAWLVMGAVPPAGMCDPRRGAGAPRWWDQRRGPPGTGTAAFCHSLATGGSRWGGGRGGKTKLAG